MLDFIRKLNVIYAHKISVIQEVVLHELQKICLLLKFDISKIKSKTFPCDHNDKNAHIHRLNGSPSESLSKGIEIMGCYKLLELRHPATLKIAQLDNYEICYL